MRRASKGCYPVRNTAHVANSAYIHLIAYPLMPIRGISKLSVMNIFGNRAHNFELQ